MTYKSLFERSGLPREETFALLQKALQIDMTAYYTHLETEASESQEKQYLDFVSRRVAGEPIQHITGEAYFFGNRFIVSKNVLIPRQDTELLTEVALNEYEGSCGLDLCCGSGCIAVSMLLEDPDLRMIAVDLSEDAIALTKQNAALLGVADRLTVLQGDLFRGLDTCPAFDFIVSNPPYIATPEIERLDRDVRDYEPRLALDGGPDGLDFYRELAKRTEPLFLEIGDDQGESVPALLKAAGYEHIQVIKDLAGLDRVVVATRENV